MNSPPELGQLHGHAQLDMGQHVIQPRIICYIAAQAEHGFQPLQLDQRHPPAEQCGFQPVKSVQHVMPAPGLTLAADETIADCAWGADGVLHLAITAPATGRIVLLDRRDRLEQDAQIAKAGVAALTPG